MTKNMNDLTVPIFAVIDIFMGIYLVIYGRKLWLKPRSVSKRNILYYQMYNYILLFSKEARRTGKPSLTQIKTYGLLAMIMGLFAIGGGIFLLVP